MSVSGPASGFYQPIYAHTYPIPGIQNASAQPTYSWSQYPVAQAQQSAPPVSKEVPVRKFAGIGAAVGGVVGTFKLGAALINKWPVTTGVIVLVGAVIGGSLDAALLSWLYNKTQTKT